MSDRSTRCPWADGSPEYLHYHDEEWGVPIHDEQRLFEFLVLEGMQAGLSWLTVLRKRAAIGRAFAGFDPEVVACFDEDRLDRLMADVSIIRHRGKLEAAVHNARVVLELRATTPPFAGLAWSFVHGRAKQNDWRELAQVPASSVESERMSRSFKRVGLRFVGPTICYAFMQATGMVNDHLVGCFRHRECERAGAV